MKLPRFRSLVKTLLTLVSISFFFSTLYAGENGLHTTLRFTYDAFGNLQTITYPNGKQSQYANNGLSLQKTVGYEGQTLSDVTDYDLKGREEAIRFYPRYGNAGAWIDKTYDALGRARSYRLVLDDQALPWLSMANMTYDHRGFITRVFRSDKVTKGYSLNFTYEYDQVGRLTKARYHGADLDFQYDDFGNLVGHSGVNYPLINLHLDAFDAVYDTGGQDNPYHNNDWSYDDAGRVVSDNQYRYNYNELGRLESIIDIQSQEMIAQYLYDDNGYRVRTVEPTRITYYVRDLKGNVLYSKSQNTITGAWTTKNFVTRNDQLVLTATYDEAGNRIGAAYQANGHLQSAALRWEGSERELQEYGPFGEQLIQDQPIFEGAYGFTGHEDDSSGLTYMRARFYDPMSGRFLTPDPARDFDAYNPSSYNLYQYVRNNPMNHVDPTGMQAKTDLEKWQIVKDLAPSDAQEILFGEIPKDDRSLIDKYWHKEESPAEKAGRDLEYERSVAILFKYYLEAKIMNEGFHPTKEQFIDYLIGTQKIQYLKVVSTIHQTAGYLQEKIVDAAKVGKGLAGGIDRSSIESFRKLIIGIRQDMENGALDERNFSPMIDDAERFGKEY